MTDEPERARSPRRRFLEATGPAVIASLGGLRSVGGYCHVLPERMAHSGGLISAFPSDYGQTVPLTGMRFRWPSGEQHTGVWDPPIPGMVD